MARAPRWTLWRKKRSGRVRPFRPRQAGCWGLVGIPGQIWRFPYFFPDEYGEFWPQRRFLVLCFWSCWNAVPHQTQISDRAPPQARAMATRKSWWCALPWLVYVGLMETMPGKTVILKELGVIYDTYMMSIYTNQLVTSLFGPYENYHALKLVVSSSGLFLPSKNFRANGQWASYDHYCGWSRVLVTYFHNIFTIFSQYFHAFLPYLPWKFSFN